MFQRIIAISFIIAMLCAGPLSARAADAPAVVVTIKPLHSIVSAVMKGAGEPTLLLPENASPHSYSLKPSDAASLSRADLVVWVGENLEAFLHGSLENLAYDARVIELFEIEGMTLLPTREGGVWDRHDPGHRHGHEEEGHGEEHAHDDHEQENADEEEHAHESDDTHDDHANEHHTAHSADPHLWLDIANASLIADVVADALAALDPARRNLYQANATAFVQRLETLDSEIRHSLELVRDAPFIVFHDAYGYLEKRYGLTARGSITIDPDRSPSAKRIAELRHVIEERGAVCVFSEPQFTPKIVETLVENTATGVGVLDPIGIGIEPGPDAYEALIRRNAKAIGACLSGG